MHDAFVVDYVKSEADLYEKFPNSLLPNLNNTVIIDASTAGQVT